MNVFIIAATSLDGFIAQEKGQTSLDWTSPEDKQFFRDRTKQAKVMVMGSTTYKTIGRPLPGRLNIIYTRQPLDTASDDSAVLRTTQADPQELVQQLEQEGFTEVAICGGASIYSMFLNARVVNKLYITVEPVLFGKGIKLFAEETQAKLKLVAQTKLGENTLLLEYDVIG